MSNLPPGCTQADIDAVFSGSELTQYEIDEFARQTRIQAAIKACLNVLKVEIGGNFGPGLGEYFPGTEELELPNDYEALIGALLECTSTPLQIEEQISEAMKQRAADAEWDYDETDGDWVDL